MRAHAAWVAASLTLAAVCGAVWIEGIAGGSASAAVILGAAALAFALVGAIIVARRPGHRIGWIMSGIGLAFAAQHLAATHAVIGIERDWPATGLSAWYGSWGFAPSFLLAFVLLPLLFPDGRLPSRRWRPVIVLAVLLLVGATVLAFAEPVLDPAGLGVEVPNPFHTDALAPIVPIVNRTVEVTFGLTLLGGVSAIVVRTRRSSGVERQQMKWFLAAAVLPPAGFAVSTAPVLDPYQEHLWAAMVVGLPLAVGVAVLRYRLYEIDRIISRTVSYALLFATLTAIYVAGVVGLGHVMRAATGRAVSDLVVAASTLAVAAAFAPVRRRVQAAVDRRFNRAGYDAQRTIERFAQRLREEVDLGALTEDLRTVSTETVHPASVSVWLAPTPVGERSEAPYG
jgi:hypothetical protein